MATKQPQPKREIVLRFYLPGGVETDAAGFEEALRKAGRSGK
jgi:hypothetical protein